MNHANRLRSLACKYSTLSSFLRFRMFGQVIPAVSMTFNECYGALFSLSNDKCCRNDSERILQGKKAKKKSETHTAPLGEKKRNSGRKKNGLEKCTLTKRHTQNPGGFWEFVDIGFFTGTPHISWYLPTEMTINQWHETCGEHSPILPCLIIISIICFKSATVVRLLIFPLSSFFMSS